MHVCILTVFFVFQQHFLVSLLLFLLHSFFFLFLLICITHVMSFPIHTRHIPHIHVTSDTYMSFPIHACHFQYIHVTFDTYMSFSIHTRHIWHIHVTSDTYTSHLTYTCHMWHIHVRTMRAFVYMLSSFCFSSSTTHSCLFYTNCSAVIRTYIHNIRWHWYVPSEIPRQQTNPSCRVMHVSTNPEHI